MEKTNKNLINKRICVLDELRGLAVIAMVIYHAIYSMTFVFNLPFSYPIMQAVHPYQPLIPTVFITLCGISCSLSHSNLKRGILLLAVSLAVTLVTALILPSEIILFGILHFLGAGLIIYSLLEKFTKKVPISVGLAVSALLFAIFYNVPNGYIGIDGLFRLNLPERLYQFYPLFIIGFPSNDFYSADYFPILPYIFLLMFGVFWGRLIITKVVPKWMYRKYCPPLDFIGKHALIIYILHQPVIIGVLFIITELF